MAKYMGKSSDEIWKTVMGNKQQPGKQEQTAAQTGAKTGTSGGRYSGMSADDIWKSVMEGGGQETGQTGLGTVSSDTGYQKWLRDYNTVSNKYYSWAKKNSGEGKWQADSFGGTKEAMESLLDQHDDISQRLDEKDKTQFQKAYDGLKQTYDALSESGKYYAQFRDQDDYDRTRSGYTNFGVGYAAESYGLDDGQARALRQEQVQKDARERQRALAEYVAAKKEFDPVDKEYRLYDMTKDEGYSQVYSEEKDKAMRSRWQTAKDKVTKAENALLNARNRMDAYNATWGKIDKYADTAEAAKGTDTSYTGPSYDELNDWENKRQEEQTREEIRANQYDYAPGELTYTTDKRPEAEDRLGLWLSMTQEQRQQAAQSSSPALQTIAADADSGLWNALEDTEIQTYYYLRNSQGQEAANQYLSDMEPELNRRTDEKFIEKVQNASTAARWGYEAEAHGLALVGNVTGFAGELNETITGDHKVYSSTSRATRYASYIRGINGQSASKFVQDVAKNAGASEEFAAGAAKYAENIYQAINSGVDSAIGAKLLGPAYLATMGMGAFAQRSEELELRGATNRQIAVGAIGAGCIEMLFEKVSLDHFFENFINTPPKDWKELVKKTLIQAAVEGDEEVNTEIANIAFDAINMGKNCDVSMAVRGYRLQGMSEEEARRKATMDAITDIYWAGFGGFVSGGAMAGFGYSMGKVQNAVSDYAVGDTLMNNGRYVDLQEQASALQDQRKAGKLAKRAREVTELARQGDNSYGNTYRMGKVATQIAQQAGREASRAEVTEFRAAAEKYLAGQRDIQHKKLALNVLTRAYEGTTMVPGDRAYMRMIQGDKLTQNILDSIGGKETLQENAKAREAASMRTAASVQGSVLGIEPTQERAAYDSDNSGQAYLKDSKDPVNIRGIAEIRDGQMYVATDEGQTVKASDVSFGSYGEAALYSAISNMHTDTQKARSLLYGLDSSGMSTQAYATALQNAYNKGMSGVSYEGIQDYSYAAKLSDDVRRQAWEAGRDRRAAKTAERAAKVDSGTLMTDKKGLTFKDSAKGIQNLNDQQKTGVAAAKVLAEAGLHIEVYASTESERQNGAPNGIYRSSDGTIHIDLNAGDNGQGTVAYALAHETTHFIKDFSPAKYQTYADILIEAAESKGISYDSLLDRQLAKQSALEENRGKTAEELQELAYDETIAEMSETMLTDTDAAQRVSQELYKQDRTLWEKIKDFFTGLVEKLRSAYKGLDPDSDMGRVMKRAIQDNETVAQAWAEAVVEAGENYQLQDGQKNNAREGVTETGVRYSSRKLSEQIDEIANQTFDRNNHVNYGSTPRALSNILSLPILPMLGTYTHAYTMALSQQQAQEEGRKTRGLNFHDLGWDMVKNIPDMLNHPAAIIKSNTDVNDSRFVVVTNQLDKNGNPIIAAIAPKGAGQYYSLDVPGSILLSGYGKDSFSNYLNRAKAENRVLWVDKNNHQKQASPGVQFPNALLSGDYGNNLAQFKKIVKGEFAGTIFQNTFDNDGNRRFSSRNVRDSEGNALTENQARYFENSQVRDDKGNLKVVYHGSPAIFTEFSADFMGTHGSSEGQGFYFTDYKPMAEGYQRDGGQLLEGYLNIKKPLSDSEVTLKRTEVRKLLQALDPTGDDLVLNYDSMGGMGYPSKAWYNRSVNDTLNAVMNNESDSEILGELANAMGNYGTVLEKARSVLGYDGYIVSGKYDDAIVYVAFDSSQFKNADNQNPTEAKDIRYSSRNNQESRVDRLVRKNEELKAEAEYLRQVVQIQKRGNSRNLLDRESVNGIAKGILESVNAKGTEFGKKLNDFYRALQTENMDYSEMQKRAGELADWALEHHQAERDGYAQEVLDFLKKRRVSLTDSQIGDAEYTYGSLSEFKKAIRGSIIIDQNSTTSLYQLWQEAAAEFPDRFSADTVAADMPDGIANVVSWANGAEADSETEFQYYKAESKADLTQKILMGFLDAKPIESVSETLKQQMADLKKQHQQEMRELRKSWDAEAKAMEQSHKYDLEAERKRGKAAVEALKYQQEVIQKAQKGLWETERADIKRSYEKQMKELREQNTQKAHEKVESRHRTEERHKLQKTIDTLNRLLLKPTNTANVPQELQSSVAMAMKVINGVILDSKAGQNADRLAKYAEQLRTLEQNPEANAEKIADLNRKISNLTGRDISMKAALTSLQEQYAKLEGQDGGLYDENIEALIEDAKETIGNTAYKDLSLKQLKAVRDTYTALLTTIRNANKAFVAGQNARIDEMVKRATMELSLKEKKKPTQTAMGKKVDQFFWNNEKPVYAFERIGSAVMSELYNNLRKGEDTFYRDVNSARDFFLEAAEKNGFDKWDLNELQEFEASNGQKFQLSLDERMSLFAYSLRPQARDHLTKGGIVLAENTKRLQRGPLGVTMEVTYDDANAYTLTDETIDAIVGSLTKEQRQFAYEMQQYLAKVMGTKGDEVNMAMYGIKKFGEETYWPLKSSGVFSERIREQQERTGNKQKNKGFTKALTQHANNAIELASLTETWAEHVNDMSMYHAFTLPMEDFYRVYNWTQKGDTDGKRTMGVRQMIQQTAGKGAVTYIDQFLKDLNGGLRADPRETVSKAMLSGFKKAAVSASLSVAIQQPSAVGRALAYIEANYFLGGKVESAGGIKETWAQLKKYAAVAGLKEMGRFDVDMGQSTLEYIIGRNSVNAWGKFTDKVDELSGWLPEMADQVTWCAIWEAAKRKTAAMHPGLKGEALLQKAGELFTDTITRTQVYDSVFSRSANMRAKSGLMSMATAFMAEPTTTANMVEDAVRKFRNGDKRMAGKMLSSVATATVLNAALAAVVYAARDDDDTKTYWEKYLASLAGETVDSFNPLTYVPIIADINNLFMGYSVERTDMSLVSDLATALKKIATLYGQYDDSWDEDRKKEWEKKIADAWKDNALMAGTIMGLPLKNIARDVEAIINTATNPSNGAEMSADTILKGMKDSARKSLPILSWKADESNSDQLYKAITQGKDVLARRLKAQFGDEKKYESALLKGLRENDPRIKEAAQYALDGKTPERVAIIREIVAEGNYTQDQVIKAINQKANSMKQSTSSDKDPTPQKLYDYDEYVNAAANGLGYAGDVQKELIRYQADRNQEKDGKLTREEAEEASTKTFKSRAKSEAKDGYEAGDLTEAQVRKVLETAGIAEGEELDDLILQWDTELELGSEINWSNARYLEYAETIQPAGISAEDYDNYIRATSKMNGIDENGDGKKEITKQAQVIEYIDLMPISDEQKDILFQAEYPNARKSVLRKLPWR